jgi:hypothetical protein
MVTVTLSFIQHNFQASVIVSDYYSYSLLVLKFGLECLLGDHGVKAQGHGWLLTVALIEGTNLAATKSSGYSDPYVVFTCNGKTKTSSIKFHTLEPQWNGKLYFSLF